MKNYIFLFLKGFGMGAANVIPGVSGGTIALITGIFEKLILSIKSFDLKAIRLLFTAKFKEFADHVNLYFLIAIFSGIIISIFSLAIVLQFLLLNYPVYIWAFFFGLILASVYFVGKEIQQWTIENIIFFVIGTAIALGITFMNQATENSSFLYLFICGIVAICSMILPGLSGSFILVLLGNYQYVLNAVKEFDIVSLVPIVLGAGFGLLAFSHLLAWLYKKYKEQTIAILCGFILGSLGILWPWKISYNQSGNLIPIGSDEKALSYERFIPEAFNTEVLIAIGLLIIGIFVIWAMEKLAKQISD